MAQPYHATVRRHECDHLDEIVYPMRVTDPSLPSFNRELGDKGLRTAWAAKDF